MTKTIWELYDDAADLSLFLRADGSDFWAERVDRAMGGATGSEIYGTLRLTLMSLLAAPQGVSDENRHRARQLSYGLRKSLPWWRRLLENRNPRLIDPPDSADPSGLIGRLQRVVWTLTDRLPPIWLDQVRALVDDNQSAEALKLLTDVVAEHRVAVDEEVLVELADVARVLDLDPLVVDRLR
jgi:hypothetical protein